MSSKTEMRFLTRQEFANHYNRLKPGLGNPDSPLWQAEHNCSPCRFFIRLHKPVDHEFMPDFHEWCERVLDGEVRCFSSGENGDWWGFTNKDDIVIWTLKWS